MQLRAVMASALLVLFPLAACSDDEPVVSDAETTATTEDEGGEPGHRQSDLEAAVEAAQLEVDDLGPEWELTATTPAGEEEGEAASPFEECVGGDLEDRVDAAEVAESEERTFSKETGGPVGTELQSSSVALDDPALFEEMHELLRGEEVVDCITDAFEQEFGGVAEVGDVRQEEGVVDPGDDADLTSTRLVIPFTVEEADQVFELETSMTVISTGQLGTSMLMFGNVGAVSEDELAEWGRLLAERLTGG